MTSFNLKRERFWEIDFLRGIAIMLMVILHFLDDIVLLKMFHFQLNWNLWFFWQRITASLFLILVGISLTISRFQTLKSDPAQIKGLFAKHRKRGLVILSWGFLITFVTKLYLREGYVLYGVLHLIGTTIIISYPFLTLRFWNLILGGTVIFIGFYLSKLTFNFPWLLWAGLIPPNYYSVDYFPLFPWFGFILIGLSLGNCFYSEQGRKYKIDECSQGLFFRPICCLGKHSLVIYLIHQPLFILLLTLIKYLE